MNHALTQYDDAKADIDSHDHDDQYYTRALADTTFYSTSYFTGFNADTLDGQAATSILGQSLPVKAIVEWSGDQADIPDGWYICDGGIHESIQTHDMRGRIPIGAGGAYTPGDTGGSTAFTPLATFTAAEHIITATEMPAHYHAFEQYENPTSGTGVQTESGTYCRSNVGTSKVTDSVGGGLGHSHTGSIAFSSYSALPLYYSSLYIIKCR